VRGQRHDPAALYSGKETVSIVQEAGWVPGPVWTGAENSPPPGFDPRTVHPVASRYTDYATRPTDEEDSPLVWVYVNHKKMAVVWVSALNISLLTWLLEVTNLLNGINFAQVFTAIRYLQPQLTKFSIYTLDLGRLEVTKNHAERNYESMY
jgi:hypothetical protein